MLSKVAAKSIWATEACVGFLLTIFPFKLVDMPVFVLQEENLKRSIMDQIGNIQ